MSLKWYLWTICMFFPWLETFTFYELNLKPTKTNIKMQNNT
jgi:hypothetical protein